MRLLLFRITFENKPFPDVTVIYATALDLLTSPSRLCKNIIDFQGFLTDDIFSVIT
jgi:hypothetical protein